MSVWARSWRAILCVLTAFVAGCGQDATTAAQGITGTGGATDAHFLEQSPDFTFPCSDVTNWRLYCAEQ